MQEPLQKATLSRLSRTHGRQNRKQQLDKHKRGAGAPGSGHCTAPREHKHCRRPRFVMMAPSMCFFQHRRISEPSTHLTGELPITATYCYCIGLTWCWERTRSGCVAGAKRERRDPYLPAAETMSSRNPPKSFFFFKDTLCYPHARRWPAALLAGWWTRSGIGVRAEQGSRVPSNGQRDQQEPSTCCPNGTTENLAAAVLLEQTVVVKRRRGQRAQEPPPTGVVQRHGCWFVRRERCSLLPGCLLTQETFAK